jgi:hypothetical protein
MLGSLCFLFATKHHILFYFSDCWGNFGKGLFGQNTHNFFWARRGTPMHLMRAWWRSCLAGKIQTIPKLWAFNFLVLCTMPYPLFQYIYYKYLQMKFYVLASLWTQISFQFLVENIAIQMINVEIIFYWHLPSDSNSWLLPFQINGIKSMKTLGILACYGRLTRS